MKPTALQKRAERNARHPSMVDVNLVSLIDVFTILIFFLLSSAAGVELLATPKAVKLPDSVADKAPKETLVIVVSDAAIMVDGRTLASVRDVMAMDGDVIAPLQAELEARAPRPLLNPGSPSPAKALTIMGDKAIPYRLLRKVMVTSARAGYADVAFAVLRKDGA